MWHCRLVVAAENSDKNKLKYYIVGKCYFNFTIIGFYRIFDQVNVDSFQKYYNFADPNFWMVEFTCYQKEKKI